MDKKCGMSIQLNAVRKQLRKLLIHKIAWMKHKAFCFVDKARHIDEYISYDSIYRKFKNSHN